jgi:GAF domain-containing protein
MLAYVLYCLVFLLLGLSAWRLIIRHEREKARQKTEALEAQAKALEATVDDRTREIRAQAVEIAAQKDSVELLSDIGKEITASLDLETILLKLYERVNQIGDASIFGVGLYRPERHLIEYSLAIEDGKRYAPYTRSTDDKNQCAVWCIDNRKPILLNDVATQFSKYIASYEHTGGALVDGSMAKPPASMSYLPLVAQERVLGVLSIQSFKKNAYTEQHLSLLENLAAYTTIALDNAGAYLVINQREHEVRERAAELVTINRITQAIATQLDKDSLIQFVGDQVRDLFRAPIAYVSLLDRSTMVLQFPYSFGEDAAPRPFGSGLTSQIIRTGQPLLINEDMDRNRAKLGIEQVGRKQLRILGFRFRPADKRSALSASSPPIRKVASPRPINASCQRSPPLLEWLFIMRSSSKRHARQEPPRKKWLMLPRPGPRLPRSFMPPALSSSFFFRALHALRLASRWNRSTFPLVRSVATSSSYPPHQMALSSPFSGMSRERV